MIRRYNWLNILQLPALRVLSFMAWIGLVLVFTLTPGDSALVEKTSVALGGSDYTDANGHVLLFSILTMLCFWALTLRFSPRSALILSAGLGLLIGTGTEFAQVFIPYRGAAWLDLGANWIGVLGGVTLVALGIFLANTLLRKA